MSKSISKITYSATVSRDGFGSQYNDNDPYERKAAEVAYTQAAQIVLDKHYPNYDVEIDITYRSVGLDDSELIITEYDNGDEEYDSDTDAIAQAIWDTMCAETWSEAHEAQTQKAIDQIVGAKIYKLTDIQNKYLETRWPSIDSDGTVTGIYDADDTPDGCVMVDWECDRRGKFSYTETDGEHGFMAILESRVGEIP